MIRCQPLYLQPTKDAPASTGATDCVVSVFNDNSSHFCIDEVNVTMGPSCTSSTKGGRKQAIQSPSLCRTLGYTIPAEPLVNSSSPRIWEVV